MDRTSTTSEIYAHKSGHHQGARRLPTRSAVPCAASAVYLATATHRRYRQWSAPAVRAASNRAGPESQRRRPPRADDVEKRVGATEFLNNADNLIRDGNDTLILLLTSGANVPDISRVLDL